MKIWLYPVEEALEKCKQVHLPTWTSILAKYKSTTYLYQQRYAEEFSVPIPCQGHLYETYDLDSLEVFSSGICHHSKRAREGSNRRNRRLLYKILLSLTFGVTNVG